jgi:hypothetical protein
VDRLWTRVPHSKTIELIQLTAIAVKQTACDSTQLIQLTAIAVKQTACDSTPVCRLMIVWSKHFVAITSEEKRNCCVRRTINCFVNNKFPYRHVSRNKYRIIAGRILSWPIQLLLNKKILGLSPRANYTDQAILISSFRRCLCTEMRSVLLNIAVILVTEYNLIEEARSGLKSASYICYPMHFSVIHCHKNRRGNWSTIYERCGISGPFMHIKFSYRYHGDVQ